MHKITRLIKRYSFFLLFVALQSIALSAMVYYNDYQRSLFMEEVVGVRGGVNSFFSYFDNLFYLKYENERLLAENEQLKNMVHANFERVPQTRNVQSDTIYIDSVPYFRKYRLYAAKVVATHFSPNNNTFQILIGSNHGVRRDMGVTTSGGIAGFITNVSANYSEVLSVLNNQYKVSATHKQSGFVGLIEWDGRDIHEMIMQHLPYTAQVQMHDTIYTSQYSEKFLPSTPIGTVSKIEKDESKNSYNIRVRLIMDFGKMMHVYVVSNLIQADQDSLNRDHNDM